MKLASLSIATQDLVLPSSRVSVGNSRRLAHEYRPDIDGLRAIAVLSVLLYHGFSRWLPGGFVGVDVFFVISGYLISGIILEAVQSGTFTFADFYARRIRRIFPALAVVLAFVSGIGYMVLLPSEFSQLGSHVLAGALFLSNGLLLREAGYFDLSAGLKPLLHLWSLAVEEQYYLLWPWILIALRGHRRAGTWCIVAIALGSFALNLHWAWRQPSLAFYLPFTRLWELMLGSLLAYARMRDAEEAPSRWTDWPLAVHNTLSAAGLAMLLFGIVATAQGVGFPGWGALAPTLGTALLIAAGPRAWINRHLLSAPVLVWVGLISYPLYLWHWPGLVFARLVAGQELSVQATTGVLAASVFLAWATYRFIERPVRSSARRRSSRQVVIVLVASLIAAGVVGAAAAARLCTPHSAADPFTGRVEAALADWEPVSSERLPGRNEEEVLFIGDSHMQHYVPRLRELARASPPLPRTISIMTRGGCAPVPGLERSAFRCAEFVREAFEHARAPNVHTVVLAASWQGFLARTDYFREGDAQRRPLDLQGKEGEAALAQLETVLSSLVLQGKQVVVVLSSPRGGHQDPRLWVERGWRGIGERTVMAEQPGTVQGITAAIDERVRAMARRSGAQIVDPMAWLCPSNVCSAVDSNGDFLYEDDTHLRASVVRQRFTLLDPYVVAP